jgi:tRNA (guanine37-N1)-methyltransferase
MAETLIMDDTMFRPPVNRAMRALDRSHFYKKIPLAAARVFDSKNIAKYRTELHDELLKIDRVPTVKQDPRQTDLKTLLLKPEIRPESMVAPSDTSHSILELKVLDSASWSTKIQELVEAKRIAITAYNLELDYDHWNYRMYVGHESPC